MSRDGLPDVGVVVDKADHAFFRVVFQSRGDKCECFFVELRVILGVRQYGSVPPYHFFFADLFGKAFEGVYPLLERREVSFNLFPVRV